MKRIKLLQIGLQTFLIASVFTMLTSCVDHVPIGNAVAEKESILPIVEDYIATYQSREDWKKFLSFYSDSLYFLDVHLKMEFDTKAGFIAFYDWPNPDFSKLRPEQKTFLVEDLVVENQTAIIKGRFQPFYWKEDLKEWTDLFTIWLHFNEDGKIIRQYDFIKYPKQFLPE